MVITPQVFLELFILCLSWQWDQKNLRHMWTTVDKVARILEGLGIITQKQRRALYKDRRTQQLFRKTCGLYGSSVADLEKGVRHNYVLGSRNLLLLMQDPVQGVSGERMLRDSHIYMSGAGREHARSLEEKYAQVITRESYLSECQRQEEIFRHVSGVGKRAISKHYIARVEDETS